jgi:transcriptional regulator with GAF, ATPase, and Fis domain
VSRGQLGETTIPVHSTRSSIERDGSLALRWVYPDTSGSVTRLDKARIVLGRDEGCDARLSGGGTSRRHAEILQRGPIFIIRDLGSTNGVFVNGLRVSDAPFSAGDLLRVGDWIAAVVSMPAPDETIPVFGEFAPGLLGGPVLRPTFEVVRRIAPTTLPIVVEGETGTGKEVLSRAIHDLSGRTGPFVAVNCAALPEALAESELFGHRKGAFTSADRASPGVFRAAEGGTILLDEVVDMPLALQAKVLRVLEQREVMPLGESRPMPVDVRVVAAAQWPLQQAVAERRFRGDLLARLNGVTVRMPPLKERKQEIPFVFQHLLRRHSAGASPPLDARLVEQLCLYDWPFNLRELDLTARRLLALHGTEPVLRRSHLPEEVLSALPRSSRSEPPPERSSAAAPSALSPESAEEAVSRDVQDERDFAALVEALRTNSGNVARAAAAVGISRQRAYRLMESRPGVRLEELRAKE